jgi:hypothetical protein
VADESLSLLTLACERHAAQRSCTETGVRKHVRVTVARVGEVSQSRAEGH